MHSLLAVGAGDNCIRTLVEVQFCLIELCELEITFVGPFEKWAAHRLPETALDVCLIVL